MMIIALRITIVIGIALVLLTLFSCIIINRKKELSIQDYIDMYLKDDICPVINDGKVIGFQFNE